MNPRCGVKSALHAVLRVNSTPWHGVAIAHMRTPLHHAEWGMPPCATLCLAKWYMLACHKRFVRQSVCGASAHPLLARQRGSGHSAAGSTFCGSRSTLSRHWHWQSWPTSTVAKRAKSFFFGHEESEFSAAKFSSSFEWVTVGHSVAHSDNFLCAQGLAQRARTMHRSKIPFVERTLVTIVQLQRLTLPGSSPNRA